MPKKPTYFSLYWAKKKAKTQKIQAKGHCVIYIGDNRLSVITPEFNPEFSLGARALSGTWRSRTQRWTFRRDSLDYVKALCIKVYGKENLSVQ